jgi:hypothetical protein
MRIGTGPPDNNLGNLQRFFFSYQGSLGVSQEPVFFWEEIHKNHARKKNYKNQLNGEK